MVRLKVEDGTKREGAERGGGTKKDEKRRN